MSPGVRSLLPGSSAIRSVSAHSAASRWRPRQPRTRRMRRLAQHLSESFRADRRRAGCSWAMLLLRSINRMLALPSPSRIDVGSMSCSTCRERAPRPSRIVGFDRWRSISPPAMPAAAAATVSAGPLARFAARRAEVPACFTDSATPSCVWAVRRVESCRRRAAPFWELAVRRLALPRARVEPFFGAADAREPRCPLALCRSFWAHARWSRRTSRTARFSSSLKTRPSTRTQRESGLRRSCRDSHSIVSSCHVVLPLVQTNGRLAFSRGPPTLMEIVLTGA